MDEFDFRDWERREEAADWNDITSGTDEQRAGALLNRAVSIGLWEPAQLERVIGYLGAAVEINRRINKPTDLFQSLKMLAEAYSRQQRWDDCIEALDEAIVVAGNELQDDRLRATALGWRAWIFSTKHDYRQAALGYANTSQLSAIARPECAARDMNFSARSWSQLSEYELAIAASLDALELARQNECLDDAVDAHNLLAYCYARLSNKDLARKHFNLAKSQSEIGGLSQVSQILVQRTQGWISMLDENYELADKQLSEAAEACRRMSAYDAASVAVFGRAMSAYMQDDNETALGFLKSIIDSAEQIRMHPDYQAVGKLFEQIYSEDGNWLDALDAWRRLRDAMRKNDSVENAIQFCDARIVILEAKLASEPKRKAEILTELRVELGELFFTQPDAVAELGRAFIGSFKGEMALRLADEALVRPEYQGEEAGYDCEWLDIKAHAHELLGNYPAAKEAADRAFELYFDRGDYQLARQMRDLSVRVSKSAA